MDFLNNLFDAVMGMPRNDAFMFGTGIIGGTIVLIGCLINLVYKYFDPNEDSGEVFEAFCMTIGAPFLAFMLTGILLLIAVMTSPIWILLLLRKFIVKTN